MFLTPFCATLLTIFVFARPTASEESAASLTGKCPISKQHENKLISCYHSHIGENSNSTENLTETEKLMAFVLCIHYKYGIVEDNGALNKDKAIESLTNIYVVDNETMTELEDGYRSCFYSLGDSPSESDNNNVIVCLLQSVDVICETGEKTIKGEKCYDTPYGVKPILACAASHVGTKEEIQNLSQVDQIKMYGDYLNCVAREYGILDENDVLSNAAAVDSLKTTIGTDKRTLKLLEEKYDKCFYGYTATNNTLCGIKDEEEMKKTLVEKNCPATPYALKIFIECQAAEPKGGLNLFFCILERAEIYENGVVIPEGLLKSIDTTIMPNPELRDRLRAAYQGCLFNYDGTQAKSNEVLKCTHDVKEQLCGQKPGAMFNRCPVTNNFHEMTKECSGGAQPSNPMHHHICIMNKTHLVEEDGVVSLTAARSLSVTMFNLNAQTKKEMDTALDNCFVGMQHLPIEQYSTVDCILKAMKHVCAVPPPLSSGQPQRIPAKSSNTEVPKKPETLPKKQESKTSGEPSISKETDKPEETKKPGESKNPEETGENPKSRNPEETGENPESRNPEETGENPESKNPEETGENPESKNSEKAEEKAKPNNPEENAGDDKSETS